MNEELKSIINDFIKEGLNENWEVFNDMAAELLPFLLDNNVDGTGDIIIFISEVEEHLTFTNKLFCKELKLKYIRNLIIEETSADDHIDIIMDQDSEDRIEHLSADEIEFRLATCHITRNEIPRIPGKSYRMTVKNLDVEYEATYTVQNDGSLREEITNWIKGNQTIKSSGFNRTFNNILQNNTPLEEK